MFLHARTVKKLSNSASHKPIYYKMFVALHIECCHSYRGVCDVAFNMARGKRLCVRRFVVLLLFILMLRFLPAGIGQSPPLLRICPHIRANK